MCPVPARLFHYYILLGLGLFRQGRFRHRIASEYSEWRFFGCTGRAPARGRHRLLTEYTVAPPGGCPTMISLLSFWQALSRGFCDDCYAFLWRVGFCDDCDTFPSGVGIGVSFTRGGKGFAMLELGIGPFLRGLRS